MNTAPDQPLETLASFLILDSLTQPPFLLIMSSQLTTPSLFFIKLHENQSSATYQVTYLCSTAATINP